MKDTILTFFKNYNIEFHDHGKGVAKDHVSINCPFEDDTEFHMGVWLKNGWYGCWHDPKAHGGKDFVKLVAKLLDCRYDAAREALGLQPVYNGDDDLMLAINKMWAEPEMAKTLDGGITLKFNSEFFPIKKGFNHHERFIKYFEDRGFNEVEKLIFKHKLRYAYYGNYAWRIIVPYFYKRKLVSWTSRSILKNEEVRYKDLSVDQSIRHVKKCLYNFDDLQTKGGKVLFICEGFFDCLKLDWYFPKGYRATCLGTVSVRDEQMELIYDLHKRFERIYICFDREFELHALSVVQDLQMLSNIHMFTDLPHPAKDPGELTFTQIREIAKKVS